MPPGSNLHSAASKTHPRRAQPHFGFWTFNNGFGMISGCGHVIYDCTGEKVVERTGDDGCVGRMTDEGKALLQTIHKDIRER